MNRYMARMNNEYNQFELFDTVLVEKVYLAAQNECNKPTPQPGDIATIVEVYSNPQGFELECCDSTGRTIWCGGFEPSDLQLKLLKKSKNNKEQLKAKYPIADLVTGWFFRVEEISNGAYQAEGTDLNGRTVSCEGSDPDLLLQKCAQDAKEIKAI